MAAREDGQHVIPVAGFRKRERRLPRNLDTLIQRLVMQFGHHLTTLKQRQWFDQIAQREFDIGAAPVRTGERADALSDFARTPRAKSLPERSDVPDPLPPKPAEREFCSDA